MLSFWGVDLPFLYAVKGSKGEVKGSGEIT